MGELIGSKYECLMAAAKITEAFASSPKQYEPNLPEILEKTYNMLTKLLQDAKMER